MTKTQTLNKLLAHCKSLGVELDANHEGYASYVVYKQNKKSKKVEVIQYNRFLPKTFLIYSILHELGHRELINEKFQSVYGKLYHENIVKLLEEILAWKKGAEIAKKIGVEVNFKGYSTYSSRALRTYIGGIFMMNAVEPQKIKKALQRVL